MLSFLARKMSPEQKETLKAIGFRGETSRDSWRCGECGKMQPRDSDQYWVPVGTRKSDPLWSVSDRRRDHCTAWCSMCVRHWLDDADVQKVIVSRQEAYAKALAEMARPKTTNELLGWDYDGWWERSGKHDAELVAALTSRPLTILELQEVGRRGYDLLVEPMQSYNEEDKRAEFASLLSIQQSIQLASARESVALGAVEPSAKAEGSK